MNESHHLFWIRHIKKINTKKVIFQFTLPGIIRLQKLVIWNNNFCLVLPTDLSIKSFKGCGLKSSFLAAEPINLFLSTIYTNNTTIIRYINNLITQWNAHDYDLISSIRSVFYLLFCLDWLSIAFFLLICIQFSQF